MEIISLVLNVVFFVFVFFGFLLGLKGIKKSGLSFACFFVAVIISAILALTCSSLLANTQFSFLGGGQTLQGYIQNFLESNASVNEFMTACPSLVSLVQNAPLMIIQLVLFVLLTYVLGFISWIVYLILASVLLKKQKYSKQQAELDKQNGIIDRRAPKKYRLLGGLVGAAHGLVLLLITLLPLTGVLGVANQLMNEQEPITNSSAQVCLLEAGDTENPVVEDTIQYSASAKLLRENLPSEVLDILNYYNNSIIGALSNNNPINQACFDTISRIKVKGNTIKISKEIKTVAEIYDNTSFLVEIAQEPLTAESLTKIDFDRLEKAVELTFSSNTIETLLPELTDFGLGKAKDVEQIRNQKQLYNFVLALTSEVDGYENTIEMMKHEALVVVRTARIFVESGIAAECLQQPVNVNNILNILSANENEVLKDMVSEIFESNVIKLGLTSAVDYGVDALEKLLRDFAHDQTIELGNINVLDSEMRIDKVPFINLASYALDVYMEVKDVNFNNPTIAEVTAIEWETIISGFGSIVDDFKNMKILTTTTDLQPVSIYDQVINALGRTELSTYYNFENLKGEHIFRDFANISANLIRNIRASKCLDAISQDAETNQVTVNANLLIAKISSLLTFDTADTTDDGYVLSLLTKDILSNSVIQGFVNSFIKYGNEFLNMGLDQLGYTGADLQLKTTNIFTSSEIDKILNATDAISRYIGSLTLFDESSHILSSDIVLKNVLLSSDLAMFGKIFDSIRSTELIDSSTGILDTLFDLIKDKQMFGDDTTLSNFIDFDALQNPNNSLETEITNILSNLRTLLNKQIIITPATETDPAVTKSAYDVIFVDKDFQKVLDSLTAQEFSTIFDPLLNSAIFRPTGEYATNAVNQIVQDKIGNAVIDEVSLENLSTEEIEEVSDALSAIVDLSTSITDETDLIDIINDESITTKIVATLEALENASGTANSGEAKPLDSLYDAVITYITTDGNYEGYTGAGTDVQTIITNNTQAGNIDWSSVVAEIKNLLNGTGA